VCLKKLYPLQVLTRLKQTPALSHIPVAMLSGLEDSTLAEVCLHQGAVEVLLKPLKVDAIARAVQRYCSKAVSTDSTTDNSSASTYNSTGYVNGSQQNNREGGVLAIGDIAPDFSLPDTDMKLFTLGRFLENTAGLRQLVLVFVPCFESVTAATASGTSSRHSIGDSASADAAKAATTAACVQLLTTVNRAYCDIKGEGQQRLSTTTTTTAAASSLSNSTSSSHSHNSDTDVIGIGQCFSQADTMALAHWVNKLGLDYRVLTDSSLGLVWKVSSCCKVEVPRTETSQLFLCIHIVNTSASQHIVQLHLLED
jgi:hypothetical protein